ncbi:MAG: hypothetical protein JSR82_04730 [Verrucomicrobia bacterium]|nr:hypothetical protein [Verrucomicrobiota bacterium]
MSRFFVFRVFRTLDWKCRLLWLAGCAALLLAGAPSLAARGAPFIRRFAPEEIGGGPQCFGLHVSPDGLVYAGTQGGLLEFDGQSWRNLTGTRGYMAAVAVDAAGRLHVGGTSQILRLEPSARFGWTPRDVLEPLRLSRAGSSPFFFAAVDPQDGSLWFASLNRLVRLPPDGAPPKVVHEGGIVRLIPWENRLLLRSSTGQAVLGWARSGGIEPLAPTEAPEVEGMIAAAPLGGGATLALRGREYRIFAGLTPQSAWQPTPGLDPENVVLSALALGDGRVLLGTQRGSVLVLNGRAELLETWSEVDGLTGGGIRAMARDAQGGVWLATDNGLARVQFDSPLRRFAPDRGVRPPVMAWHWHGGRFWAGNAAGAWRQNEDGVLERQRDLPAAVWGFLSDGEDLLVAGRTLMRVRPGGQTDRLETPDGFAALGKPQLDPSGNILLVPTSGSVLTYRRSENGWQRGPNLPDVSGSVFDLAFGPRGSLWLADSRTRVLRMPWEAGVGPAGSAVTVELPGATVVAPNNLNFAVWRGTLLLASNAGLHRWDPARDRFERADELGAFAAERQTHVQASPAGALWVFGSTGPGGKLTHLARRVLARGSADSLRYEVRDLPTASLMPAMTYGVYAADDDHLYLYGEGPVGVLDATRFANLAPVPPPARIRRLLTPAGPIYEGGPRPSDAPPLVLPLGQRSVTLEFAAPWFPADSLNRTSLEFRSRLVGDEGDWSAWGAERRREFTNLAPGAYRFEAQTRLAGEAGEAQLGSLAFVVPARAWETTAARLAFVTAGALLVALVVRFLERVRLRRRIRLLEQSARVENERLRIARDMHDDLGSSLAHIVVSAQRLREHPPGPQAQQLAEHISSAARQVMGSARDIIWSVTPQHDTLDALADYTSSWVHRACSDAGLQCALDVPNDLPGLTIPGPVRHTMLNVTKEALQNVLKHAQATRVQFRVRLYSDQVAFSLSDNGTGLRNGQRRAPGTGLGMESMEVRMRSVGGRVELLSEADGGTTVKYVLPLPNA